MSLLTESEEVIRLLPERHVLSDKKYDENMHGKMTIRMAYEVVMPYHLHMPSIFFEGHLLNIPKRGMTKRLVILFL